MDKHKTQVNSFVINDAEACNSLYKYVGDLWTSIQSQIGMEQGICPMKRVLFSARRRTCLNFDIILGELLRKKFGFGLDKTERTNDTRRGF